MKSILSRQLVRRLVLAGLSLLPFVTAASAQEDDWRKPFPGHRIIGNLYAVGSYDLGVYLIASDEGHVLINTGLEDSTPLIRQNIESLGYRLQDVKILLSMQAHWDHAAAQAEIKKLTGAGMWATAGDAGLLEDGGYSDPLFGGRAAFAPVAVDRIISDGETIELGDIRLMVHEHPGHTIGSSSYSMQVSENGSDYNVVIANMGSINPGTKLVVDPTYEGIADDLAGTYKSQLAMEVDVWVAAHASQYGLHEKYQPGQAYHPDTFVDPAGFRAAVSKLQSVFAEQLERERKDQEMTLNGL
jgi:metallo-beta-lactamase class B